MPNKAPDPGSRDDFIINQIRLREGHPKGVAHEQWSIMHGLPQNAFQWPSRQEPRPDLEAIALAPVPKPAPASAGE